MSRDTAIVMFLNHKSGKMVDLELPLTITANDLVVALNTAYGLGIDTTNIRTCYLKTEQPIALLRGNKTLAQYGIRNGTVIHFTD